MKRTLCLALFATFITKAALANIFTVDLSGLWDFSAIITEDGKPFKTQLNFVATPFKTTHGGRLYLVEGDMNGWDVWAASIEDLDGQSYIAWWGQKGNIFDGEGNMILSVTAEEISLGGDFETYEVAKMFKISGVQ